MMKMINRLYSININGGPHVRLNYIFAYMHIITFWLLEFSKWMNELDRRSAESMPSKGSIASKTRVIGTYSQSVPPINCPSWAIDKEWKQAQEGIQTYTYMVYTTCFLLESSEAAIAGESSNSFTFSPS